MGSNLLLPSIRRLEGLLALVPDWAVGGTLVPAFTVGDGVFEEVGQLSLGLFHSLGGFTVLVIDRAISVAPCRSGGSRHSIWRLHFGECCWGGLAMVRGECRR